MTPRFADAVDPVFLHVLGLLDRIGRDAARPVQEERVNIRMLIDQAGAKVGGGPEWELARYALASWIDEVLLEAPWEGRDWWNNNKLEVDLFGTALAYEQFYTRAQEAAALPQRDALEICYVCVVLGFRGMYRAELTATHVLARNLPPDLETWTRQTAMAIRVGQGRPPIAEPGAAAEGAPPLHGQAVMIWCMLGGIVLAALGCAFALALLFFRSPSSS